jgi:hypothetical protein
MSFAVHQVSPLISVVLAARPSVPHPMVSLPCCLLFYGVFDIVVFKYTNSKLHAIRPCRSWNGEPVDILSFLWATPPKDMVEVRGCVL